VKRKDTVDISGTQMRELIKEVYEANLYLPEGDYASEKRNIFMNFLPNIFGFQDKVFIGTLLLNDYVQFLTKSKQE
jgi:hypothetical protein